MSSKRQDAMNGNGMTCLFDNRQKHVMRQIVIVAQRNRHLLGPYKAARFLYANSVPFEVALRVIVGRKE